MRKECFGMHSYQNAFALLKVLFLSHFLFRLFLLSVSLGGGCEKVPWSSWWISLAKTQSAVFTCIFSTTTCCCRYRKSETSCILNLLERISCMLGNDILPFAASCFLCFTPIFCFSFHCLTCHLCFLSQSCQRREVYSNQPRSSQWTASRKLPHQTSLPPEEPVPVANVNHFLLAKDWHTVRRSDDERNSIIDYQGIPFTKKSTFLSFYIRSDKLRWISALKRPHDQVDFSAAQGKQSCLMWQLF